MCKTRASCDFLLLFTPSSGFFAGDVAALASQLVFSSQLPRFPSRSTWISLLSLTTSLFLLTLHASSVMGTSPLLGLSLAASCSVALSRDRLGPRVLPVRGLPRLQLSVPFLFGLPPLPALMLRSPRGGSCRRVHDLFLTSVLGHFLQCALLPSTHSLRMLGSVSPFLRSCPFCTQDLVPGLSDPLLAASLQHLDIPIDFNALPANSSLNSLSVSLTTCHVPLPFFPSVVPTFVVLPTSTPWMTAGWNGLLFTLLPKVPLLLGFFNLSVVPAGRPRPARTFLLCPQSRVLSVPPLNSSSFTAVSISLLSPLFLGHLLLHPTMTCRLTVSHGPLSRFPSLFGWGRDNPTPPGSGTQSWLFCPLISLGLALAESRHRCPSILHW